MKQVSLVHCNTFYDDMIAGKYRKAYELFKKHKDLVEGLPFGEVIGFCRDLRLNVGEREGEEFKMQLEQVLTIDTHMILNLGARKEIEI